jgi:UDP-N-acetylmuramoylalanine--D-glutamate ligase
LGIDNKISDALGVVDIMLEVTTMSDAVKMAQKINRGDTVLLSPACASFDCFKIMKIEMQFSSSSKFIKAVK